MIDIYLEFNTKNKIKSIFKNINHLLQDTKIQTSPLSILGLFFFAKLSNLSYARSTSFFLGSKFTINYIFKKIDNKRLIDQYTIFEPDSRTHIFSVRLE